LNPLQFHTILVSKVHSAVLAGTDILERFPGRKNIDIHDIHANHFLAAQKVLHRFAIKEFFHAPYNRFLLEKLKSPFYKYQTALDEELRIYMLFDTLLTTSWYEYEWLRNRFPAERRVKYLPPLVLTQSLGKNNLPTREKYDAGLLANSGLFNVEGIRYFDSQILPEIFRRMPEFRILIAGGICDAAREILGKSKEITYIGRIDNLIDFYGNVKAVLVPLLSGTGVSVKTIEGISYGKPVVSTTAGIRGLEVRPGTDVVVEDDPQRYAESLLQLLGNVNLRETISREALDTIREKYSLERHHEVLKTILMGHIGENSPEANSEQISSREQRR
jgi:glycosyltransferase involved in cell wall biosynthesis